MPPSKDKATFTQADAVTLQYHLEKMLGEQRAFLEALIRSQRETFDARLAALQLATEKATTVLDERFNKANEIRGMAEDERDEFARKEELGMVQRDIADARSRLDVLSGKASQGSVNLALLFSLLSACGTIIAIVMALTK